MRGQSDGAFERGIGQGGAKGTTATEGVAHDRAAGHVGTPEELRAFAGVLGL